MRAAVSVGVVFAEGAGGVGADGAGTEGISAAIVNEADGALATEVPIAFVAFTVNVYEVPVVSPEIKHEVVSDEQLCPPLDVAVYPVIAEPPL